MRTVEGFADINGARLYYQRMGEGLPLVLIHGFTLDHRMWDDQVAALEQRCQITRYDLRGFGQSSLPTDTYSHVDDLKELLTYLDIKRAALLGLSMGGGVALNFALAHPDVTCGLILADSTLRGFPWSEETDAMFDAVDAAAREGGVEAARASWLAHPFFFPAKEQPAVDHRLRTMIADYSGWHWTHSDTQVLSASTTPQLEAISVPTLVIVGERDISDFRAISNQLVRRIPDAQEVVIPRVGHMSNMEAPSMFNWLVQQFLLAHWLSLSGPAT